MFPKKPFKKGFGASTAPYYKTVSAPSYTGPGDVVSGATLWGSSARAYSAAFAASGAAIMDLLDQAGANPITINILTTGFADVTAITNWVTANSVSTIKVTKIYDQTGNGNHCANVTLAQMPTLTLSALNGLPGMTGVAASAPSLTTAGTFSVSQPYTMSSVFRQSATTAERGTAFGAGSGNIAIVGGAIAANTACANAAVELSTAALNANFHAIQGIFNGATNSVLNVNGTEVTGSLGTSALNGTLRFFRGILGSSLTGIVMEGGMWPSAFNSGQRTSMNSNLHGANGYNF